MSDNVVDLNSRRPGARYKTCACGSTWWVAKVVIEGDRVMAYADLVCNNCGQPWP